jgi:energy-coupling factor transport system ATP-binding protein
MDALVKFESASYVYPGGDVRHPALDNVTLSIFPGEFVTVLGHNGSGKSTLAKLCNGVLTPTTGTVSVLGMNTKDEEKLLDIRQSVGMVFQNPDNQLVATVVEEDVAFALENLGVAPGDIRKRVDEVLETVQMTQYKLHAPHRLSGGQKQRVAIAGVLAMYPQCLVLDESTAMLDPKGREEVISTVLQLNRDNGMAVVLITHHMSEASKGTRIVVMHEGKIAMDDTPQAVFSRYDELKKLGLSVPVTVELTNRYGLEPALDPDSCAKALSVWISREAKFAKD